VEKGGRLWRAPPWIGRIVNMLGTIDDDCLRKLEVMVGALSGEAEAVQKVQGS
jgi:hypothetical protein